MAIGDDYATLEELRDRFPEILDERDDPAMERALSTASRWIEDYTGRQFNAADTATSRMYRPVTSTYVQVDDIASDEGLQLEIGSGDTWTVVNTFECHPLNHVVNGRPSWPYMRLRASGLSQDQLVRVTARWGWPEVPSPIKEATLITAAEIWKLKDSPFGIAGGNEMGDLRVLKYQPRVMALIGPYRRGSLRVNSG